MLKTSPESQSQLEVKTNLGRGNKLTGLHIRGETDGHRFNLWNKLIHNVIAPLVKKIEMRFLRLRNFFFSGFVISFLYSLNIFPGLGSYYFGLIYIKLCC